MDTFNGAVCHPESPTRCRGLDLYGLLQQGFIYLAQVQKKRREKWFYMLLNVFKCFLMFCFDALLDRKKVKTSWFLFGACDRGLERILDPHDFVEYITYFILQDMQFS